MDYFDIAKVKLIIPELWKKDWDQVLEETDEKMSIITQAQIRLVHLLENIKDTSFSFSRVAWLCLWTRLFNIIEGVKGACYSNSEMLIDILDRMFFEYWLQISTIALTESENERIERLNAYAAWSLYNDLIFQKYLVKDSIMDGIWDIEDEKSVLESSKEEKFIREKIFGQLDTEKLTSDYHEAKKRKLAHKSQEYKKRDRIEKWLEHKDLKPWIKKIEASKRYNPSFFQLFDKKQNSLFRKLKSFDLSEKDIEFAYTIYKQSSMTIHGSSFLNNFTLNSDMISPNFTGDSETIIKKSVNLGSQAYSISLQLLILKKDVWSD